MSEVAGVYTGTYGGAQEVFEINPDGYFVQTLTVDGQTKYKNAGTWRLAKKPGSRVFLAFFPAPTIILFDHFFQSVDPVTGERQEPPKLLNAKQADWNRSRQRIEFRIERGYVINKQR